MRPSTPAPPHARTRRRHGPSRAARGWPAILAALLPAAAVHAAPEDYAFDPVHTRVAFEVSHAGFSQAIGTVSGATGILHFDPGDWTAARVEVRVPVARLDLGDGKWNHAALAGSLLDGARYPVATFVSTRIEPIDPRHASVYGNLTLHGTTREVKLDVALNALKRHPLPPFRRTAGFSATATLSRRAFGIDAWPTVIGDAVTLRIEAEATRARDARAAADATPDAGRAPAPPDAASASTDTGPTADDDAQEHR